MFAIKESHCHQDKWKMIQRDLQLHKGNDNPLYLLFEI